MQGIFENQQASWTWELTTISRSATVWVLISSWSAKVLLPWSMWAMIEKFLIMFVGTCASWNWLLYNCKSTWQHLFPCLSYLAIMKDFSTLITAPSPNATFSSSYTIISPSALVLASFSLSGAATLTKISWHSLDLFDRCKCAWFRLRDGEIGLGWTRPQVLQLALQMSTGGRPQGRSKSIPSQQLEEFYQINLSSVRHLTSRKNSPFKTIKTVYTVMLCALGALIQYGCLGRARPFVGEIRLIIRRCDSPLLLIASL